MVQSRDAQPACHGLAFKPIRCRGAVEGIFAGLLLSGLARVLRPAPEWIPRNAEQPKIDDAARALLESKQLPPPRILRNNISSKRSCTSRRTRACAIYPTCRRLRWGPAVTPLDLTPPFDFPSGGGSVLHADGTAVSVG
jgi:hypothetical protein